MIRQFADDEKFLDYAAEVHKEFADNGYSKYCVDRPDAGVSDEDLDRYQAALASAEDEKPMQSFLTVCPQLVDPNLGGQCRWVFPTVDLGRRIPDFLSARLDSTGLTWTIIELKSPRAQLFTKKGHGHHLAEAIEQIQDTRRLLTDDGGRVQRPRRSHGLGLTDLDTHAYGMVIIGRSANRIEDGPRLRQIMTQQRISVRSYDSLAREVTLNRKHWQAGTCRARCDNRGTS